MDEDNNAYEDDAWGYMAEDDDLAYYEYDDGAWEDDGNYDEFDCDAVYYQETTDDPIMDDYGYDPDEYDECFASYVDARRRFNELRMSRGFLRPSTTRAKERRVVEKGVVLFDGLWSFLQILGPPQEAQLPCARDHPQEGQQKLPLWRWSPSS